MNIVLFSVVLLGIVGLVSAVILYYVAQKFSVVEDERIDIVESLLPAANCGGCGFPGCRGFAEVCVKADSLENLICTAGGADTMKNVAQALGKESFTATPMIAVVRCNGTCEHRQKTNQYDGAMSCAVSSSLYSGDSGCAYGCLSHGDCVFVCKFDAIHIHPETGLPEVDEQKCTACGACVKACPKSIIEMRKKGPRSRRIYVSCINKDKAPVARKACNVACISCGKCQKVCEFNAITIAGNVAYIDPNLCRLCRKCPEVCPTSAIVEVNFPIKKRETIAAEEN